MNNASLAQQGRISFFLVLTGFCIFSTYYFHFIRGIDIIYSHIFYLPISLAGVWWGRRAIPVSFFMGLVLVLSHLLSGIKVSLDQDLLRMVMFVIVGTTLGLAVDQRNRLQREMLREHEMNMEQMMEHLQYVERVAHELRNPLQVSLGALDSLREETPAADRKLLLDMLNRSADTIRARVNQLTADVRR